MVDLSQVDPRNISSLTDAQEKALYILYFIPSILSALGSSQIIYMVLTAGKTTPYRRILLGLSIGDFLSSCYYPVSNYLMPQETSQRIWAFGNDSTCSFVGWCQVFFLRNFWCNGMLSFYFVVTVKYGVTDTLLARRYEKVPIL